MKNTLLLIAILRTLRVHSMFRVNGIFIAKYWCCESHHWYCCLSRKLKRERDMRKMMPPTCAIHLLQSKQQQFVHWQTFNFQWKYESNLTIERRKKMRRLVRKCVRLSIYLFSSFRFLFLVWVANLNVNCSSLSFLLITFTELSAQQNTSFLD